MCIMCDTNTSLASDDFAKDTQNQHLLLELLADKEAQWYSADTSSSHRPGAVYGVSGFCCYRSIHGSSRVGICKGYCKSQNQVYLQTAGVSKVLVKGSVSKGDLLVVPKSVADTYCVSLMGVEVDKKDMHLKDYIVVGVALENKTKKSDKNLFPVRCHIGASELVEEGLVVDTRCKSTDSFASTFSRDSRSLDFARSAECKEAGAA